MNTQLKKQHIKSKQAGFIAMPLAGLALGLGIMGGMVATQDKERVNYNIEVTGDAPIAPKPSSIYIQDEDYFENK